MREVPADNHGDDLAMGDAIVKYVAKCYHLQCNPKCIRDMPAMDLSHDIAMGDAFVNRDAKSGHINAILCAYGKCQR